MRFYGGSRRDPAIAVETIAEFLFGGAAMAGLMILLYRLAPETYIGMAGLTQIRRYLYLRFFGNIVLAAAVFLCPLLGGVVYRAIKRGEDYLSRRFRLIVGGVLAVLVILLAPCGSLEFGGHAYQQMEMNGYRGLPLMKVGAMILDIEKDMKEGETTLYTDQTCTVQTVDYVSHTRKHGTSHHFVWYLKRDGFPCGELSRQNRAAITGNTFEYAPHDVAVYKNSGLIASIDGAETLEFPPMEALITLTYDDEAGRIHRTLLPNEDSVELTGIVTMDGEIVSTQRIPAGEAEIIFDPAVKGEFTYYIEMGNERVSNVITVIREEDDLGPELPVRGRHKATVEENGDVLRYTDETYGFSLDLPASLVLDIKHVSAKTAQMGSDRELAETIEDEDMFLSMKALERPWFSGEETAAHIEADWLHTKMKQRGIELDYSDLTTDATVWHCVTFDATEYSADGRELYGFFSFCELQEGQALEVDMLFLTREDCERGREILRSIEIFPAE